MVEITRATREKSKLRIALAGVSGGGKTLGALLLASGLTGGDFSKVCLIDTEHRRGELYANRSDLGIGEFWYIELKAPYSPDRYKECVDAAVQKVGPDGVVIVDSLSHAWNSSGGVLEIKAGIAAQPNKNSYTAWDEAGRIQNNFINYLPHDLHSAGQTGLCAHRERPRQAGAGESGPRTGAARRRGV